MLPCPACDGRGCGECNDGQFEITGCPRELLGPAIDNALLAADLAEKGSWPLAGGWLDQTQSCLDAVLFIWGDQARWKAQQARERA